MPRIKAANNAVTTLVSGIDATVTSFSVTDASKFPDAPFRITVDAEIMEVGAIDKVNNVFSNVQRGLEGTVAASHNAGAAVENRWTAGTYNELLGASDPVPAHKTQHASGGSDALAPADIGAASATDLNAHLADNANPHEVSAEQVFALGGVPAGTTFPTSPAPYTLFFHTDLNKLFVYLP